MNDDDLAPRQATAEAGAGAFGAIRDLLTVANDARRRLNAVWAAQSTRLPETLVLTAPWSGRARDVPALKSELEFNGMQFTRCLWRLEELQLVFVEKQSRGNRRLRLQVSHDGAELARMLDEDMQRLSELLLARSEVCEGLALSSVLAGIRLAARGGLADAST